MDAMNLPCNDIINTHVAYGAAFSKIGNTVGELIGDIESSSWVSKKKDMLLKLLKSTTGSFVIVDEMLTNNLNVIIKELLNYAELKLEAAALVSKISSKQQKIKRLAEECVALHSAGVGGGLFTTTSNANKIKEKENQMNQLSKEIKVHEAELVKKKDEILAQGTKIISLVESFNDVKLGTSTDGLGDRFSSEAVELVIDELGGSDGQNYEEVNHSVEDIRGFLARLNDSKQKFEDDRTNFNAVSCSNVIIIQCVKKVSLILQKIFRILEKSSRDVSEYVNNVEETENEIDNDAGGGGYSDYTPTEGEVTPPNSDSGKEKGPDHIENIEIPLESSDNDPNVIDIPTDGTTDGSNNPLRGEILNAPDTTFLEFFEEFCTDEYYGTGTVVEFMSRFMTLSGEMFGTLNSTDGSGNPRPEFMEYFNECTEVKQVNSLGDPYNAVNSLDEYLKNYKTLKNGSAFGVDKMTFEKYYEEFISQNPDKNSFENVFSSYFEYIKD